MTVKELKKVLENYNDDLELGFFISESDGHESINLLEEIDNHFNIVKVEKRNKIRNFLILKDSREKNYTNYNFTIVEE